MLFCKTLLSVTFNDRNDILMSCNWLRIFSASGELEDPDLIPDPIFFEMSSRRMPRVTIKYSSSRNAKFSQCQYNTRHPKRIMARKIALVIKYGWLLSHFFIQFSLSSCYIDIFIEYHVSGFLATGLFLPASGHWLAVPCRRSRGLFKRLSLTFFTSDKRPALRPATLFFTTRSVSCATLNLR